MYEWEAASRLKTQQLRSFPAELMAVLSNRDILVQIVVGRLKQDMGEIVHQRYEPRRNFQIALFVQPFAQLHQFIVDP